MVCTLLLPCALGGWVAMRVLGLKIVRVHSATYHSAPDGEREDSYTKRYVHIYVIIVI